MNAETIVAIVAAGVSAIGAALALWQARSARAQALSAERQARAAEEANRLLNEQLTRQDVEASSMALDLERRTLMQLARTANLAMHGEIACLKDWGTGAFPPGFTRHTILSNYDHYLVELAEARAAATSEVAISAIEVIEAAVRDATNLRKAVTVEHPAAWGADGARIGAEGAIDQIRTLLGQVEQMQFITVQLAAPGRSIFARVLAEHADPALTPAERGGVGAREGRAAG